MKENCCVNHPTVKAEYNSIQAGGDPLCFNCAVTEAEKLAL